MEARSRLVSQLQYVSDLAESVSDNYGFWLLVPFLPPISSFCKSGFGFCYSCKNLAPRSELPGISEPLRDHFVLHGRELVLGVSVES